MRNHHPRCRSLQVPSVLEVLRAAVGDEGFRRDPCLLNSGERDLCAPWISAAVLSFWMAKVSTLATPFWMRFHQVEKLTNEASWQLPTCWIRVFKGLLRFMNSFKKKQPQPSFFHQNLIEGRRSWLWGSFSPGRWRSELWPWVCPPTSLAKAGPAWHAKSCCWKAL